MSDRRAWQRWLLDGALVLGLLAVATVNIGRGDAFPVSDEAGHVRKVTQVERELRLARTPLKKASKALFSTDAYPQLYHAAALLPLSFERSLTALRLTLLPLHLVHLLVGLVVGRRLWGGAAARAYALMVGLSPVALAWSRFFYIDVPLVSLVGIASLLALGAEGGRRRGATLGLAAACALGLQVKWVFGFFLVGPLLALWVQGARLPGRSRLGGALVAAAQLLLVGLILALTVVFGQGPLAQGANLEIAVQVAIFGWAALALLSLSPWPRGPGLRLGAATALVGLTTAPWYATMLEALRGRVAHEGAMQAKTGLASPASWRLEVAMNLVPLGLPLLGISVLGVILSRKGAPTLLACGLSAALSFGLVSWGLPFDPRYQLPLLPLIAAAIAAGWSGLGRLSGPLTVVLGALLLYLTGLGAGYPTTPATAAVAQNLGGAVDLRVSSGLRLPRLLEARGDEADPAVVSAVIHSLRGRIDRPPPQLKIAAPHGGTLQMRGLEAMFELYRAPVMLQAEPKGHLADLWLRCADPHHRDAGPVPSICTSLGELRPRCEALRCGGAASRP